MLKVLQRAGWRLKWAVWRWMELGGGDGAGWRRVHGLAIPIYINTLTYCVSYAEWYFVWSLYLNIYELDRRNNQVECAQI